MERIRLREEELESEAKGFAGHNGEENTLSDAEIRHFQVGSAANSAFPEIDESLLDQGAAKAEELNPLLVADSLTPRTTARHVEEDPKFIQKTLAGADLSLAPEENRGIYREIQQPVDPSQATPEQLATVKDIFAAPRQQNLNRVVPSEGPLGDPTQDGEVPIDITSARIAKPSEIRYGTDHTPASAYLNNQKTPWQVPPKNEPPTAAETSSFFGKIKTWFGG